MSDVAAYVKRAAERTKFKREFFIEQNLPTVASNVVAVPFYPDLHSSLVMSSFILRQYKDLHRDKYVILCSWPGWQALFPYVDEYWTLEDESVTKTLAIDANNFYNGTKLATEISQSLLECMGILTHRDFKKYYNFGFTDDYWNDFGEPRRYLPEVPSESLIADGFRQQLARKSGHKIVLYPVKKIRIWQSGKLHHLQASQDFWSALTKRLLDEGYTPVVWQNWSTYDLSREFADSCVYLVPRNVSDVLAAMRYVGIVLDVYSGVSRMAIAARTPFVAVDERLRFIDCKDYALDDLSCDSLPRQYIFSNATMLLTNGPKEWTVSIIDNIVTRLKKFIPETQEIEWGSTSESYEPVSYDRVRKLNARRMGVHFIGSSKNK
jgi:hypothetical protein